MPSHTIVPFDVTGWEASPYDADVPGPRLSRVTVRKTYRGALSGDSVGELLMCIADENDLTVGAGYVISERVIGSLDGRGGSFVMQHWGVSGNGAQTTAGHIVPGSGTGELTALTGTLTIAVGDDGAHTLALEYSLVS